MPQGTPRRPAGAEAPPLISLQDLGLAVGLPLLFVAAGLVPGRAWKPLAHAIAPLAGAVLSRSQGAIIACVEAMSGEAPLAMPAPAIARELVACEIQVAFQIMRDHMPGRWHPDIELRGATHIEAALARGAGAVLWDSHFQYAGMVTKMALHRAGFVQYHLSHPRHGFSATRFGMGVLNRVRTACEGRYVAERVVQSLNAPVGAMRLLLKRLRDNGLVSVTVRDTGLRPCIVPFLAGRLSVATGAPDLAYASGAALIPVFTVQDGEGYVVTAEAPIPLSVDAPRRRAARAVAAAYAERLAAHVVAHPGQWLGWLHH